jgi:hypothetical protein
MHAMTIQAARSRKKREPSAKSDVSHAPWAGCVLIDSVSDKVFQINKVSGKTAP